MGSTTRERHTLEFAPIRKSSIRVDEHGIMRFEAIGINETVIESKWLQHLADDSVGKHVTYRHRHPQQEEHKDEPYYGRVETKVLEKVDGSLSIINGIMLKNTVKRQRKLQELVKRRQKEDNPMGLSYQYDVYKHDGEIVDIDVVEVAVTWKPAVKEAIILEERREETMPGKKKEKKIDPEAEKLEKEKAKVKEKEKTDAIQKALDEKTIETLEGLDLKLKKKMEEVEVLKRELEQEKAGHVQKLGTLAKRILKLEKHNEFLETKEPVIREILKLEGDTQAATEWYPNQSIEWLNKRLEAKKAEPKIRVETAHETEQREPTKQKISQEEFNKHFPDLSQEELKAMYEGGNF